MLDVIGAVIAQMDKTEFQPYHRHLKTADGEKLLKETVAQQERFTSPVSWRTLRSKLFRLNRLKVFDRHVESDPVKPITYAELLRPRAVSVIDLSDSGLSELSNIVIADLLRGVQEAQDKSYEAYERAKKDDRAASPPTRVLLIIEEAHEFLSSERIDKMPILFQQVARIAKRGRKRWLGLVFVTQLPQHMPRQVFGLVNSYVLHKITDPQVVSTLQRQVSNIDDALWRRLPGLAPGQALVSFPHMKLPLLATIDPAGAKLRLVD
jgi:DNA helicase HerA-like ATPase